MDGVPQGVSQKTCIDQLFVFILWGGQWVNSASNGLAHDMFILPQKDIVAGKRPWRNIATAFQLFMLQEQEVMALEEKRTEVLTDEKEIKLIELIRSIGYGELRVIIQDMKPIRVEELKKSIKL